jgi:hypothetical protein
MNAIYALAARKSLPILAAAAALVALALLAGCNVAVRTYHYDNLRTGWNSHEHRLRPSNVNPASIEYLALGLARSIPNR